MNDNYVQNFKNYFNQIIKTEPIVFPKIVGVEVRVLSICCHIGNQLEITNFRLNLKKDCLPIRKRLLGTVLSTDCLQPTNRKTQTQTVYAFASNTSRIIRDVM